MSMRIPKITVLIDEDDEEKALILDISHVRTVDAPTLRAHLARVRSLLSAVDEHLSFLVQVGAETWARGVRAEEKSATKIGSTGGET